MKTFLLSILFVLITCSFVLGQSNFTQEWETPSNRVFVGISSSEQSNSVPEIICRSSNYQTIYVYDGATKQIKYTYTEPDSLDFTSTCASLHFQPLDVNNDGIFEMVSEKRQQVIPIGGPDPAYKLKVFNGANGQILYQNTYNNTTGESQLLDIDGDGYTEICIHLYSFFNGTRKLIILSTTSNYVGINNTGSEVNNYELKQNYPNPFNPSTTIEYSIKKNADVQIKIYDISGREIQSLAKGVQGSGTYKVNLTSENLSSGTYFYQILVDGISEAKKMVVIK